MLIGKEWKLKDIQSEFQNQYPFLKIEFYKPRKDTAVLTEKVEKLNPFLPVTLLNSSEGPFELNISGDKKVSDLKHLFKNLVGCNILIYRKSGSHWIETSYTEDWTLQQQNEEGKLMSES